MHPATLAPVFLETSLGWLLVAATPRGVAFVRFGESRGALEAALRHEFPFAAPGDPDATQRGWARAIAGAVEGGSADPRVPLDVRGSVFERRVWQQLASIPRGETRSYGEVARAIGRARGARAVARACARNPVPVAVPCHRVIESGGGLGGYSGGLPVKRALLEREGVAAARGDRRTGPDSRGGAEREHAEGADRALPVLSQELGVGVQP